MIAADTDRRPAAEPAIDPGLWPRTFRARYAGIVALAIAAAVVPSIGPERGWIAVGVLVYGLAYNGLWHRIQRRQGRPPSGMAYTDMLTCVCLPLIEPVTFLPTLLVMLTVVALAAVAFRRRSALRATVVGTIGLAVVVGWTDVSLGAIGVIGFGIAAWLISVTVGDVADEERRVRARMRSLVDGLDAVVWESVQPLERFSHVSGHADALLGYPAEAWTGESFWSDHLHPDDRARAVEQRSRALADGAGHAVSYRMIAADGRTVHLYEVVSCTLGVAGQVVRASGVMVDISARMSDQERVEQYAELVDRMEIGLIVLVLDDADDDLSLRLAAANPAAYEAVRQPLDSWMGRRFDHMFPDLTDSGLPQALAEVARTGAPFGLPRFDVVRDGVARVFSLRAFPLAGRAVGVSLEDITGRSLAADAMRQQALHDGLTGLPNRTLLKQRLREALHQAKDTGGSVALLLMDLDQFKEVNDALGHHHGDLLLQGLADRLVERFPDVAAVARLGGDEFAMLLTATSLVEAEAAARAVGVALEEPFRVEGLRLEANASIGIALYPDHAIDADSLSQRADVAMYQAKRARGGYSVYAADADRSSVRRVTLMSELRRALDHDELVLHYQPVLSIKTGRVVRVEALARWDHPTLGLVPPAEFIELAELSGLIQPLTRWVVESGVATVTSWRDHGHRVGLAVNLSVRNLYDPGLPDHLASLLARSSMPASDLVLEITESELMDDPSLALAALTQIHELGVAISVDDFGTGYSSLTYLKDLPIGEIKVDRSFVGAMGTSADDLTIVRSTIDLGHNLGLEVVAEGIEDAATLAHLADLGCDLAQGYHLSPPLVADELQRWLRRRIADGEAGDPSKSSAPFPLATGPAATDAPIRRPVGGRR